MSRYPNPVAKQRNALTALTAPNSGGVMLTAYEQCKPLERVFVDAYVATDNPLKSLKATHPDIRPDLVNVRALDYMRRPLVQAAIAEKQRAIAARWDITAENVVREIALLAFARMGDYVTKTAEGEAFLDLNKIPEDELSDRLAAVSELTVEDFKGSRDEGERDIRKVRFKLHDKGANLDKLMKRLGAYAPDNVTMVHTGADGGPVQHQHSVALVTMSAKEAAELYAKSLED